MRAYINEVWDMFSNFFIEHRVRVIPILENKVAYLLATTAGNFKVPVYSKKKYKITVVHRPSILDNSKYWEVFEDDMQIKIFLEMSEEFVNTQIDTENQNTKYFHQSVQSDDEDVENKKLKNVIRGKDIIQLKINYIPKRLIPLE